MTYLKSKARCGLKNQLLRLYGPTGAGVAHTMKFTTPGILCSTLSEREEITRKIYVTPLEEVKYLFQRTQLNFKSSIHISIHLAINRLETQLMKMLTYKPNVSSEWLISYCHPIGVSGTKRTAHSQKI